MRTSSAWALALWAPGRSCSSSSWAWCSCRPGRSAGRWVKHRSKYDAAAHEEEGQNQGKSKGSVEVRPSWAGLTAVAVIAVGSQIISRPALAVCCCWWPPLLPVLRLALLPNACRCSLHPRHTLQWIAQFEITAVIVLLGLLSSLSLFGQYWDILTGATPYEDIQKPLLAEEDEAQGAEAGTLDVTGDGSTGGGGGGKAYRRVSTGGGVVAIATQPRSASNWYGRVEVMDEQERAAEHVLAQTVASPRNIILAPDPFHGGMPVVFRDPGECPTAFCE